MPSHSHRSQVGDNHRSNYSDPEQTHSVLAAVGGCPWYSGTDDSCTRIHRQIEWGEGWLEQKLPQAAAGPAFSFGAAAAAGAFALGIVIKPSAGGKPQAATHGLRNRGHGCGGGTTDRALANLPMVLVPSARAIRIHSARGRPGCHEREPSKAEISLCLQASWRRESSRRSGRRSRAGMDNRDSSVCASPYYVRSYPSTS